ncbi:hypothetical protein HK104_006051 [Borealophlyctis nickersoniae]|nr:hypothetical protein HK104_006051 [Borealophlyctis nickersoniae]
MFCIYRRRYDRKTISNPSILEDARIPEQRRDDSTAVDHISPPKSTGRPLLPPPQPPSQSPSTSRHSIELPSDCPSWISDMDLNRDFAVRIQNNRLVKPCLSNICEAGHNIRIWGDRSHLEISSWKVMQRMTRTYKPVVAHAREEGIWGRKLFGPPKERKDLKWPTLLVKTTASTSELLDPSTESNPRPDFYIVSHVWGKTVKIQSKDSPVSGVKWSIPVVSRDKLDTIITHFSNISVANNGNPVFWWMDVLCMDQDTTGAVTAQVAFMGDYYTAATEVVIILENAGTLLTVAESKKSGKPYSTSYSADTMIELLLCDWSQRVWTFQEMMCNPQRRFLVLHDTKLTEIDIPKFAKKTLKKLRKNEVQFDKLSGMTDGLNVLVTTCAELSVPDDEGFRKEVQGRDLPLAIVMCLMANRKCSYPEDHLYGMLGMLSDSSKIPVNYAPNRTDASAINAAAAAASLSLNTLAVRVGDASILYCSSGSEGNQERSWSMPWHKTPVRGWKTVCEAGWDMMQAGPVGKIISDELVVRMMIVGYVDKGFHVSCWGQGPVDQEINLAIDVLEGIIASGFSKALFLDVLLNGAEVYGLGQMDFDSGRMVWTDEYRGPGEALFRVMLSWLTDDDLEDVSSAFTIQDLADIGAMFQLCLGETFYEGRSWTLLQCSGETETLVLMEGSTTLNRGTLRVVTEVPYRNGMWTPVAIIEPSGGKYFRVDAGKAFLREQIHYERSVLNIRMH